LLISNPDQPLAFGSTQAKENPESPLGNSGLEIRLLIYLSR
jgi:hypothetical protein